MPIEKQIITNGERSGKVISKKTTHKIEYFNSVRFMSYSISNPVDNLVEETNKARC